MDSYRPRTCDGCDRDCGEPVKAGWVLIAMGISMALVFRHSDAVVGGIGLVLLGAWILSLKEEVR